MWLGPGTLATAIANAVLDVVLQPGFLSKAQSVAATLRQRLVELQRRHADVLLDVRGAGLLFGMKCVPSARDCVSAILDAGMLIHTADGNVLRLLPPLVIDERHVDEAIACLERGLSALAAAASRTPIAQEK